MIREKAIFIKLNQLHYSDRQLFDAAVAGFKPSSCGCPKCGAVGRLSQFRPYRRFMVSAEHGSRSDTELIVPRFRCGSCGCTHALLPDSLIPFGSYSLRFVLTVLLAYLNRSDTVLSLRFPFPVRVFFPAGAQGVTFRIPAAVRPAAQVMDHMISK